MKKSILNKHPIQLATDVYASYAENNDKFWYLVDARVEIINREEMLVLHFFSREDLLLVSEQPDWRVFMTREDYISQRISDRKWFVGRISHLLSGTSWGGWKWHNADRCRVADEVSAAAIERFLGKGDNPLELVHKHQDKVLEMRLDKRHAATLRRIDEAMAPVRDVPDDFERWIRDDALYDSRYIYYKYSKRKAMDGYCTHCRTEVKVTDARHNAMGTCPACGSVIRYKSEKKATQVHDRVHAALMQPYGDGLVIRYFCADIDFRGNYRQPKLYYGEIARAILKADGTSKWYEWAVFKQRGACRWCDDEGKWTLMPQALYTANLQPLLHDTQYRYCAIECIASVPGVKFNVYQYLTLSLKHAALEYLAKLGFTRLVNRITYYGAPSCINLSGSTPQEVLKLSTAGINRARAMNASADELKVLQRCEDLGVYLEDGHIGFIASHLSAEAVGQILKFTTTTKAIRYLNDQIGRHKTSRRFNADDTRMHDVYHDWMDYLGNAGKLQYDLKNEFALFPRDLKRAHDNAALLVKEKEMGRHAKAFAKIVPKLMEQYSWQFGPYIMRVPETAEEVIREGHTLHHCVGTYMDRIVNGSTVVLMLRKKEAPAEPFYTVEVRGGDVIQCRGKHNASMDAKIRKVIDRFKAEKLQAEGRVAM